MSSTEETRTDGGPPLIERLITASGRNKFLVLFLTLAALAAGFWSVAHTPLDAIPDLSDVQVIIYTDWEGRSPDLVEDQITYPISRRFIAAPKVKFVRGESMFGKSFVYVIFEDGTDIYWARSRVIEYLNSVRGSLPDGVNPVIGPDATGVGWVYEYALIDETGKHNLAELRSLQDWHLRYALESVPGVAEVASVGGFVKEYQVDLDPNKLAAYGIPLAEVVAKIRDSNGDVGGKIFEAAATEYFIRGRGYIKSVADIENIPLKSVGRHAGLCEESRNRSSRSRFAAGRGGIERQRRNSRRHCRHAVRRKCAECHRRDQKQIERNGSFAAGRRQDCAHLRPQHIDSGRHQHVARKTDRGKHRRGARLPRFPLARPFRVSWPSSRCPSPSFSRSCRCTGWG